MGAPNIIPSIFTAIDALSAPVKRMGISIMGLAGISVATTARMERSFARVNTAAMTTAAASAGIAAGILIPLGLATKAAIDFEQEMGNVGTLIDTTKESLTDMGDQVLKMSKIIPKSTHDLSLALYQIRSDGIRAGNGIDQAFGVLQSSGKLAVAGLATTTEAAKTVTSAMNVFADATLNSQQIANSMFKTVQGGKTTMSELGQAFGKNAAIVHSAGVSLYEMNAATAAITATGITAAQAQNELGAAVLALMKPTGNLQTIFENLGYSGEGGFKKLIVAAGGLVPAMEKINATANKLGITMSEDFGRKEALVANILLTGERRASYYEQLAKQMDGIDTLNGKFGEQSQKAAARMQLFKNSANRLGISLGNLLIPAFNKLTDLLTPIIDGLSNFAKEHKDLSGVILKSLAGLGIFAASVGSISLVVGTVTRGFALWRGAIIAWNFISGVAFVKMGLLNSAVLETTAGLRGAKFATSAFGASLTTTLGVAAALYYILKGISYLEDKRQSKKDYINQHLPHDLKAKYGTIRGITGTEVEYNNGSGPQIEENAPKEDVDRINSIYNSYDSVMEAKDIRDKYLQQKNDSMIDASKWIDYRNNISKDSLINQNDTATYQQDSARYGSVPFIQNSSSKQNITLTIENNSGHPIAATSNSNTNRAAAVQIIINSTSRPNLRQA